MMQADVLYDEYQRNGFVVVHNVLSWGQLTDFLANEPRKPEWGNNAQPLRRFRTDPHWYRLVANDCILQILSVLVGGLPRVVEAIYLPKFAASYTDSAPQGVAFHRDIDHIRAEPQTLVGCWVAMNDTDAENGGLCVVPRTHVVEPKLVAEETSTARSFVIQNEMRDRDGRVWIDQFESGKFNRLDPSEIVPLSVPSRAAVFFHGSLVHGSFSNTSPDRDRLAVSIHYIAEGSWVFRTDLQEPMAFC